MRNMIIERLEALQKDKMEFKKIPPYPNELELKKDIVNLMDKELNSLIEEGRIHVTGVTINKQRILRIK